jgi:hypothetical protein
MGQKKRSRAQKKGAIIITEQPPIEKNLIFSHAGCVIKCDRLLRAIAASTKTEGRAGRGSKGIHTRMTSRMRPAGSS